MSEQTKLSGVLSEWRRALKHRKFRVLVAAEVVGGAGVGAMSIAIVWSVWAATESFAWIGIAAASFGAAGFVFSAVSGWATDRYSPRALNIAAMTGLALTALGMYLLWDTGTLNGPTAVALLFARGLSAHLSMVAWRVSVCQLVPADDAPQAARVDVAGSWSAVATGPALALLLGATVGLEGLWLAGIAGSFAILAVIAAVPPERPAETEKASPETGKPAGWKEIIRQPQMGSLLAAGLLASFTANALWDIAAGTAAEQYRTALTGFVWFSLLLGAGVLAGIAVSGTLGDRVSWNRSAALFLGCGAAGVFLSGITSAGAVGAAGFFFLGTAQTVQSMSCNAQAHQIASPQTQARTLSLYFAAAAAGVSAGAIALGVAADLAGIRAVHMTCAALLGLAAALAAASETRKIARPGISL